MSEMSEIRRGGAVAETTTAPKKERMRRGGYCRKSGAGEAGSLAASVRWEVFCVGTAALSGACSCFELCRAGLLC